MPEDKLKEDEKAAVLDAFRKASLSEEELQRLAMGESESGETVMPVDTEEDLISAAATALEFVESLDTTETRAETVTEEDTMAGFDSLLQKLESLRSDIASLQRGVVGVFASQLLTFRGKVVELKSRISEEMVEKLKMPMFKNFIETSFVEIIDQEFAVLEKSLVDKIIEQTQQRFKEFAEKVRESEVKLRTAIVEQQNIVRSFMESLEEDTAAVRQEVTEKEEIIKKLEKEIDNLRAQLGQLKEFSVEQDELLRKLNDYKTRIQQLEEEIRRKEEIVKARNDELAAVRTELAEVKSQLTEVKSEVEVYKSELAAKIEPAAHTDAEYEALKKKIELLENTIAEKRKEAEEAIMKSREFEEKLTEALKQKETAEKLAEKRLKELDSMQEKITEVKNLEERIYELEQKLKKAQERINIVEMQREAYEKATRLMEKERDMALEVRDLANERAERYIRVLGMENNTKVLLLVDEVGSMTFADLGKALGIPVGLATKYARELEKIGMLKIEGDRVISTLRELKIEEGEVKVD